MKKKGAHKCISRQVAIPVSHGRLQCPHAFPGERGHGGDCTAPLSFLNANPYAAALKPWSSWPGLPMCCVPDRGPVPLTHCFGHLLWDTQGAYLPLALVFGSAVWAGILSAPFPKPPGTGDICLQTCLHPFPRLLGLIVRPET